MKKLSLLVLMVLAIPLATDAYDCSPDIIETIYSSTELEYREQPVEDFLDLDPNYFINHTKDDMENLMSKCLATKDLIDINKRFSTDKGLSTIQITIKPKKHSITNLTVYESIPKEIIKSASDIDLGPEAVIIEDDPLIMWHYEKIEKEIVITYEFDKLIDVKDFNKTKTIMISDGTENTAFEEMLIPIFLIPLIVFVLILVLNRRKKPKRYRVF